MRDREAKMEKNAYFTVEAALVLPVVMCTMLFVIYMLLFQYNRCLMEQDLGAVAMWGSREEAGDTAALEEKIRERLGKLYLEKYVAWEITRLDAGVEKNCFTVKGAGQLTFPVPEWNFWDTENTWGVEPEYCFRRLSTVDFIRLCHKTKSKWNEQTSQND